MVTSSFLPGRGGIESFLAELCALVAPRLAVLAPAERDGRAIPGDLGYPTRGYAGSMLLPRPQIVDAIERAARDHGTDRILFGTPWPLLLLGPRLKRRGLRYASLVYGAETLLPSRVPGLSRALAQAFAEAELLLVISRFTEGVVRSLLEQRRSPAPPIDFVSAHIDLHRFHAGAGGAEARGALGIRDDDRVVLSFGRLVKRKGVHRLLEALPAIGARVPETVAVIAGAGPQERRLRRRAAGAGRVYFAGRVPDAQAPGVYAAADVFVLPVADRWFGLEAEGLGVVLLEAAACEVPCVTGRSGGSPEAVVDGQTGFVVDATRREELVERIVWMLEHRDEARAMGRAGRSFVEQRFSAAKPPTALLEWLS